MRAKTPKLKRALAGLTGGPLLLVTLWKVYGGSVDFYAEHYTIPMEKYGVLSPLRWQDIAFLIVFWSIAIVLLYASYRLLKYAFRRERPASGNIGPKDFLTDGAKVLRPVLKPNRFRFRFRGEGKGSGGNFAWAEFVRRNRRLELHFRQSLGLVRYHLGDQSASHESYMRELGVWEQCHYPGFSNDPKKAFDDLAHDLGLADDFLSGSAVILQKAAEREAGDVVHQREIDMAGYVGDTRKLDQLRGHFHEKRYAEVIRLAGELKFPDQITLPERRMIEIARKRTNG